MPTKLKQQIGLTGATCIVIGSVIGSGVFMKPSAMAAELPSAIWLSITWAVAGIISLFGALIFAELGAMMPESGGPYVYFRKSFGSFFAFLYGWSAFAVTNTAAIAAISFVCAEYANFFLHLPRLDPGTEQSVVFHLPFVGKLFPLENIGVKLLAVTLVVLITWLNSRSVRAGNGFQVVSTIVKIALIGGLILGIFFAGNGHTANLVNGMDNRDMDLLSGFVVAMTGAFFAYDGWINVSFIAGEIRQPQRNIPRSLWTGVGVCILIYVLVNLAYLYVLPVREMAGSSLVASDAIDRAWGKEASGIVAALIVICTVGSVNGNTMASARLTYAMGRDRVFVPWTGKEHPRFLTPANSLWLQAGWTILFILTGSFNMLADMFVFVTWVAYLLVAVGIFVLRRKMPDVHRPYKTWGYPFVPVIFIGFTGFYLVTTLISDVKNYLAGTQPVINSLLGLALVALGIPIYYYYRRRKGTLPPAD